MLDLRAGPHRNRRSTIDLRVRRSPGPRYVVIGPTRLVISDPVKIGTSYLVIGATRLTIANAVKIG